jgi:rhodanese-related sulfurtransferase
MKKINEKELKKILEENPDVMLINVLPEDSFEQEHIPKSINIPLENGFLNEVESQVADKDELVIVYCASTQCSASTEAAKQLEEKGYQNVHDFKGGMQEWRQAGNQVAAGV